MLPEIHPEILHLLNHNQQIMNHKNLTLAKDRLGEKPMYYGFNEGIFFFGSELKSFKFHPKFNPDSWFFILDNNIYKIVAVVHAETSTGVRNPIQEIKSHLDHQYTNNLFSHFRLPIKSKFFFF